MTGLAIQPVPATPAIRVRDLAIAAAGEIVRPMSFDVYPGVPFTILGSSGSGKSLLSQAIMGNLPEGLAASGRVEIDGVDVLALPQKRREAMWGRTLSLLPQEPWHALDPTMTALPQVAETYRYVRGLPDAEARMRAAADLDALGLPGDTAGKLPMQLSGGMAQRVVFAAAQAGGAPIVIVDEPTKGLDAARRDDVVALLKRAADAGGVLLTITHDIAVARQLGGYVMVMRAGELQEEGEAHALLANPRSDYARRLIAADPENWPKAAPRRLAADASEVLRAEGLAVARGGRRLVSGFDLRLRAGEIVGITGDSGCGKSSLGDTLLGLLPPGAGRVTRAPGLAAHRFLKLYQDPPTAFSRHWPMRVLLDDVVRLHRLDRGRIPPLMERLRLAPELLERNSRSISGGELQRFSILRALLLDPALIFADEPTSRLDPIIQREIVELLVGVARERQCALLLVSHDMALVDHVCDRSIALGSR